MRTLPFLFILTLFLCACNNKPAKPELATVEPVNKEQEKPFSHLESLPVKGDYHGDVILLHYNKSLSTVINQPMQEGDKDWSDFFGNQIIKLVDTRINEKEDTKYRIFYSPGMSADPSFIIARVDKDSLVYLEGLNGFELYIPGDGNLFIEGHVNNMFNERKKFRIQDDSIVEVPQPFYYVGLKTTTGKAIQLFSDTTFSTPVAALPANSEVEVLINKNAYFLLKTPFGLTGWITIPSSEQGELTLKGIYYNGD
jgi:hypothetical protein